MNDPHNTPASNNTATAAAGAAAETVALTAATPAPTATAAPAAAPAPADFNSYERCEQCGDCCHIRIVAIKPDEVERMRAYIRDNNITPRDNGPECCPLLDEDMRCMVWPVRSQTCRLHHCHKARLEILDEHPEIEREDDRPWLDMYTAWLEGDFRDPRTLQPHELASRVEGFLSHQDSKTPTPDTLQ